MTKVILLGGVVIIGGLAAFLFFQPTEESPQEETNGEVSEGVEGREEEMTEEEDVAGSHVVSYADSGFSPAELTVQKGDTVTFRNESSRRTWPATAVHPSHTVYPGSGIGKCGGEEEGRIFDACGDVQPGEEWSFVFGEVGTWRYHDHRRAILTGTIVVEE